MEGLSFLFFISAICTVYGSRVHQMEIPSKSGPLKKGFAWKNCYDKPVPLTFKTLSISPDHIEYGKPLKYSFELDAKEDVGTTNTLDVAVAATLKTEGAQPINLCDYKPDLCHFTDFCTFLKEHQDKCPAPIKALGNKCQCPLLKNTYSAKDQMVNVPGQVQIDGQLDVTVKVTEGGKPIGCLNFNVCLGNC